MSQRMWNDAGVPVFNAERQAGLRDFWNAYDANHEELNKQLMALVEQLPKLAAIVKQMTPKQIEEQNRLSLQLMRQALLEGNWEPLLSNNRVQGATYAALGVSFREWFEIVSALQALMVPALVKAHGADVRRLTFAIGAMNDYIDIAMSVIGDEYLITKERLISQQQEAIRELSTPILQLNERLLLLPIVGVLDTERARALTERLLTAIRDHRAKAVIVDITGVPAVDSQVANHLLRTVAAARLMGATVFVTGLSPHVAQVLVTLGVDLSAVHTHGDLRAGVEAAMSVQG